MDVEIKEFPKRRFAVRRHEGDEGSVDETRRPLYQHLIMHELVGGPPVLRFDEDGIDVMVGTTEGFHGDDVVQVEVVPPGWFAVHDYEGPPEELEAMRARFLTWCGQNGHDVTGPLLQVHMMDVIEGVTEQQFQVPIDH